MLVTCNFGFINYNEPLNQAAYNQSLMQEITNMDNLITVSINVISRIFTFAVNLKILYGETVSCGDRSTTV